MARPFGDAVRAGRAAVTTRAAPRLTVPALFLYGERDEIIPPDPTCRMLATLPVSSRVVIYPDGYHMLTRDLDARVVLEDLAAWLADAAASLPSGFEMKGRPAWCAQAQGKSLSD